MPQHPQGRRHQNMDTGKLINGSHKNITTLEGTDWVCEPTRRRDLCGHPPAMHSGFTHDMVPGEIWPVGKDDKGAPPSAPTGDRAIFPPAGGKTI